MYILCQCVLDFTSQHAGLHDSQLLCILGVFVVKERRATRTRRLNVQKSDRALKHIQDLQALVKAGHKVLLLVA